jgi:hypothetical protein
MYCGHQVGRVGRVASRQLGLAFVVLLIVLVSGCGAQSPGGDDGARTTADTADKWPSSGTSNASMSQVSAAFALLQAPTNGVPAPIGRIMSARFPGMRWNHAERVPTGLPDTYWLVPGIEHLCLLDIAPKVASIGTVCETNAQALHHGIANASLDRVSHTRTIVGVVPEGTRTVTIESGRFHTLVRPRHGEFVHSDSITLPPDQLTLN